MTSKIINLRAATCYFSLLSHWLSMKYREFINLWLVIVSKKKQYVLGICYIEYLARSSLFSIVGTLKYLSEQNDWVITLHKVAAEKRKRILFSLVWFHTCINRGTNHSPFISHFCWNYYLVILNYVYPTPHFKVGGSFLILYECINLKELLTSFDIYIYLYISLLQIKLEPPTNGFIA